MKKSKIKLVQGIFALFFVIIANNANSSVTISSFQNVVSTGTHPNVNLTFYEIDNKDVLQATINVQHPTSTTGNSNIQVVAWVGSNAYQTIVPNTLIDHSIVNSVSVLIEDYRKWETIYEGQLKFQVIYSNSSVEYSNSVWIIKKSLSLYVENSERDGKVVLSGCHPNVYIKSKAYTNPNASVNYTLEFQEVDYSPNRVSIGNTFTKNLSSSEANQLNQGTLSLVSLINGSNVSLSHLKRYRIYIIANNSNGLWLDNTNYFVYKNDDWDLMIRDHWDYQPLSNSEWGAGDLGEEYNNTTSTVFNSNDIWNRLTNNSGWASNNPPIIERIGDTKHQNPDYSTSNANFLFTKINNIGCDDKPNNNSETVVLRQYWTRARLGEQWNKDWIYNLNNNFTYYNDPNLGLIKVPLGSEITILNPTLTNPYNNTSSPIYFAPAAVPVNSGHIFAGRTWYAPNKLWYNASNGSMSGNGDPVICFLAKFQDSLDNTDKVVWEQIPTNKIEVFVRQNNNVATRNVHLMDDPQFIVNPNNPGNTETEFATVIANNPSGSPTRICFKNISEHFTVSDNITNYAEVQIGLTSGIWNNWVANGMQGTGFNVVGSTLLSMTNSDSMCLDSISIGDELNEQIGVRLLWHNSASFPNSTRIFNYVFTQTNIEGFNEFHGSDVIISIPVSPIPADVPKETEGKNTGVIESVKKYDYILYPNPTNQLSVLSIFGVNDYLNICLELYDISGKLLSVNKNFIIKDKVGYFTINPEILSNGIYFIKVRNGEEYIINEKLVIE